MDLTGLIKALVVLLVAACGSAAASDVEIGAREGGLTARGASIISRPEGLQVIDSGPWNGAQALSIEQGSADPLIVELDKPLGTKGTVSFWARPRKWYRSGPGVEKFRCDVVKIDKIGKFWFQHQSNDVLLAWDWDWNQVEGVGWAGTYVPEFPGPEWYQFVYTWDAGEGLFECYLNGVQQQQSGVPSPWTMVEGNRVEIRPGVFDIADLRINYKYTSKQSVRRQLPVIYLERRSEILGYKRDVQPISADSRRGKLLHESGLNDADSIKNWVLEGPGVVEFRDGWMEMSCQLVDGKQKGHIVHWCPDDFPESFVAEWEFQQTANKGLCIVFFAARGENGEDIFDPKFPKRDGTFSQYTSAGIVSYHISYFASARGTANLRKNNKFYLIANGPPGIQHLDTGIHKLRLVKDGAHMQFLVDGRVIIDYTDNDGHYGPPYGAGKIGLRQMQDSVCRYRNFKVWELK